MQIAKISELTANFSRTKTGAQKIGGGKDKALL